MRGLLPIFLLCCLGLAHAEVTDGWYHEVRPLYAGIPIQVRFTPADASLADEVWRYLGDVDEFNDYRDDSPLGRINAGGPGRYSLSPRMAEAFATAAHLTRLTDGAFDITVGPLRHLWRDAERTGVVPTPEALAATRRGLGPHTWRLDGTTLEVLVPGVRFDFGGLIKGMSVDHAMRLLVDAGAQSALVQSSGESGCFGVSMRGKPHVLGIPDPDAPDARLWCSIGDQGHGFSGSTSGNYRNAIQVGGKPYYHIFDPRTGLPVDTHVLSVSVAFPVGFRNGLADGLTKVGAVLGWEKMHALAEKLGGGALVLIRRADGTVEEHASPTWERLVVKSHARMVSEQAVSNTQKEHP